MAEDTKNSKQGKIIQVIGAVVDAEFPEGSTPEIYDALEVSYKLADSGSDAKLVWKPAAFWRQPSRVRGYVLHRGLVRGGSPKYQCTHIRSGWEKVLDDL